MRTAASIIAGAIGGKSVTSLVTKKTKAQIMAGAIGGNSGNSGNSGGSAPIDNSHSHSNKDARDARDARDSARKKIGSTGGGGGFMGKNQTERFTPMTNPNSVDRGGRTILDPEKGGIDPVGIAPAINPPMAVPSPPDIDKEGVNSLYSPMKVDIPKTKSIITGTRKEQQQKVKDYLLKSKKNFVKN